MARIEINFKMTVPFNIMFLINQQNEIFKIKDVQNIL